MIRQVAKYKVWFDRSKGYVASLQFLMVAVLFVKPFENTVMGLWLEKWAIITVPVCVALFVVCCVFIGWLDLKLGIRSAEFRDLADSNPVFMEILTKVKELGKEKDHVK